MLTHFTALKGESAGHDHSRKKVGSRPLRRKDIYDIGVWSRPLDDQRDALTSDELRKFDAYWRASLYLCLGMLYLKENPLLREPLKVGQTKPRLLGHWGSDAGQSFTYIHFNRLINKYDLNAIFISGPGHGAPAVLSNAYLEGTYSEVYPDKSQDLAGMQRFFKQFSFPGGIGSHATPETPGSIHEGGELGYSVSPRLRDSLRPPGPDYSCNGR